MTGASPLPEPSSRAAALSKSAKPGPPQTGLNLTDKFSYQGHRILDRQNHVAFEIDELVVVQDVPVHANASNRVLVSFFVMKGLNVYVVTYFIDRPPPLWPHGRL